MGNSVVENSTSCTVDSNLKLGFGTGFLEEWNSNDET